MKISANEEYGLRIMIRVASFEAESPDKLVGLNQIASSEGITPEYTASIITLLRNADLIESIRGKNGGYKLVKTPSEITLYSILSALSDKMFATSFCDSHTGIKETCMHSEECSIRPVWNYVTGILDQLFHRISLAELMRKEAEVKDVVSSNMLDVVDMIR